MSRLQFSATGGIFLRLDTSGNLNFYDTTGTSIGKFSSGFFGGKLNSGTFVSNAPITSTTSTSLVALGNTIQITPIFSGRVLVIFNYHPCSNSVGGADGVTAAVYQSTGSNNPAGGAVPDGSAILGGGFNFYPGTTLQGQILIAGLITGLTVGTAYSFEGALSAIIGGTATVTALSQQVIEL